MSKIFCCNSCRKGWQLMGEPGEVASIAGLIHSDTNYGCITPLCSGRLVEVSGTPVGFSIKELPIRSFYRAIHGFGSGEGDPAAASDFAELLKTKKIVDMTVTAVGQPERVIVHQLVLEDGTRLHFDSSTRGACCYYIERPGKSCVEVVEDELSTVGTSVPGPDSNREEVGRSDADAAGEQRPEQLAGVPSDAATQPPGPAPVWPVRHDAAVPESQHAEPKRDG